MFLIAYVFLVFNKKEVSDSFFVYRSLCVLLEKKIEKKRRELSLLSESNSRLWEKNVSSSQSVVVDFFFFDEEERRNAKSTTTKKRARRKKGRNSPARVKTPRCTRTPFVRSFPTASFHSSCLPIFTFPRQREKANDE